MPQFSYKGRDRSGKQVNGLMDAASADGVATQLMNAGVTPINIEAATAASGDIDLQQVKYFLFGKTVNIEEMILFSRQMYSLTKAGIPIIRAVRGLAESVKHPVLAEVLDNIANDLESGVSVSSCMARHPKVFSDLYINLINVGENTGRLDVSFKYVAQYLDLERDTMKRIKSATRYPTFVLSAIAVAMVVINIFVIPAFAKVFEKFNTDLPWQTQVLISTSNFTVNNWPLLLIILVGSIYGFKRYLKTEEGLYQWDKAKLNFPIVGDMFQRIYLGRFSRSFAMVTSAGVPIVQGLTVVANAIGNAYLCRHIQSMRIGIERGESLTRTATESGMFTPLVLQMFSVGEETGSIDELLDEVADFYEQEVEYDLKGLADAIEPILIIAIGGMVLILALGVFLPLWDLSSAVKR